MRSGDGGIGLVAGVDWVEQTDMVGVYDFVGGDVFCVCVGQIL